MLTQDIEPILLNCEYFNCIKLVVTKVTLQAKIGTSWIREKQTLQLLIEVTTSSNKYTGWLSDTK